METSGNLNFANTNSLWGSFLADTLFRLGIRHAVISPGSRSAPLAYALAVHPGIRAVPVVDERSASFFALGIAKRTRYPVALVCTSGTAVANFFPAIIEARESRAQLLILTSDRPSEMRDCGSGQTIDQVKIFGHYPRWQAEVALPEPTPRAFAYLRQTLRYACERTLWPVAGPVHMNFPFRDPLAPVVDGSLDGVDRAAIVRLLEGLAPLEAREMGPSLQEAGTFARALEKSKRPIVVAGPATPGDTDGYVRAVARLAGAISAPVLADALSPLRQRAGCNSYLVCNYEFLIERGALPAGEPDLVLRLGELPASKRLRDWIAALEVPQWVVEEGDRNVDPLHGPCVHLRSSVSALLEALCHRREEHESQSDYLQSWITGSRRIASEIEAKLAAMKEMFEGKLSWLISRHAPPGTTVFISNSTPVRDAALFWESRVDPVEVFFNRGANGIDGIVSTAMGLASDGGEAILVTGDLAFLHDQNGLLNVGAMQGGLTVFLINNGGGGIFRTLPVARFDPPFEQFFLTPQKVCFETLCAAYGICHDLVDEWGAVIAAIEKPCRKGIRVIEIRPDAAVDFQLRKSLLEGK